MIAIAIILALDLAWLASASAQPIRNETAPNADAAESFSFAVLGTAVGDGERTTQSLLRAVDASPARFVVHFNLSAPSTSSCADVAIDRRRTLLDASSKPAIPITSGSEWADCGRTGSDPIERLERLGDTFFDGDESLGQSRLPWLRQSAVPRFHRYRENLRWQVGRVLFATVNLPDNNNNFRIAAGRNGEFEERLVANRAWLDRTFRFASERRLAAIVIFVDAAPRFGEPLRVPDTRSRERDGYYEWKLAFRDFVPAFKGQVLLVQARTADGVTRPAGMDRPLQDVAGRPIPNLVRIALGDGRDLRWLRVDVDAADPQVFRVTTQRAFDDPSGELYGPARGRSTP